LLQIIFQREISEIHGPIGAESLVM